MLCYTRGVVSKLIMMCCVMLSTATHRLLLSQLAASYCAHRKACLLPDLCDQTDAVISSALHWSICYCPSPRTPSLLCAASHMSQAHATVLHECSMKSIRVQCSLSKQQTVQHSCVALIAASTSMHSISQGHAAFMCTALSTTAVCIATYMMQFCASWSLQLGV